MTTWILGKIYSRSESFIFNLFGPLEHEILTLGLNFMRFSLLRSVEKSLDECLLFKVQTLISLMDFYYNAFT